MICSYSLCELSYWPLLFLLLVPLCLAGAGRSVFSITDGCADSSYQILDHGGITGAGGHTVNLLEAQICQPQTFPAAPRQKGTAEMNNSCLAIDSALLFLLGLEFAVLNMK